MVSMRILFFCLIDGKEDGGVLFLFCSVIQSPSQINLSDPSRSSVVPRNDYFFPSLAGAQETGGI